MGNDNRGRRYDDAFRAEAVALVVDKKLPVSRAAEHVGVAYETLIPPLYMFTKMVLH